ncbi:hypothetical protein AB0L65_51700 [Nonomuraea sp. NPDC052116]|uniref:hypothetical protein n=1 Tax=Nonomuraea sp. NPDC052116 TaxID=3155665 RepID=UPI003428545C
MRAVQTYFAEEVEPLVLAVRDANAAGRALTEATTASVETLAAHRALLRRHACRERSPPTSPYGSWGHWTSC